MIEGTIILPSLEDFKYDDHDREESSGDDLSLEFFDDCFDEKLKMDWRIARRHKRKVECCTKWAKQSDGLGNYYTKKTNPCGCPECEKCIPSKINNYRKAVYSKYGPVIFVNYATRFDIKTEEDIDRAYMLRTYWRQLCAAKRKTYLFSWDDVPGNDNESLIEFLKKNFGIDWVRTAKIEKIDNERSIKVSFEKNYLSLKLNDKKTEVNLEIDDGRTDKFDVKIENSRLIIYRKANLSIQIVNNGIILVSNDIEQVKIPEHDEEHGITNDDIEIVNVENNHPAILVNRFDEFAKKCVYFDVPQEIADHWFRKYSGLKKMLHIGREIYKKPKLKIACAVKAKDEVGNMVETHYYAQTCQTEPVSDNEAKYLGTAVYVEIDDPNVFYGLHDGSYLTLEDFVKKIEYNRENPYVADWFMYFGSGKKSMALLLKLKEQYEKKNDDGG